ncbi:NAD(P)-dependent oxidoreductase [Marinibaculum pumilum]|uniref:NAD(P)-dependent oxidoreductase n=1 Tax=Marinibaculum pumilum TaxID=1766165 RepID=A0ABV7KZ24_9PROT
MSRILIPDAQFPDDYALEREAAAPCELQVARAKGPDDLPPADWAAADALVVYHRMTYGADIAARCPNVRLLCRVGVGVDNVDVAAWTARGAAVCNVPDYGTDEVADHAVAMLLALARGLFAFQGRLAGGRRSDFVPLPVPDHVRRLSGARLLLLGLGPIAVATARRAQAFGIDVAAWAPRMKGGMEKALGIRRVHDLASALGEADMVSLHLALTDETRNLIDAGAIAAMRPGALLVNTARGGLVDLDALTAALQEGRLGGAALDVFPVEPPDPAHPLIAAVRDGADWARGRVVLSPHAAWASPEAMADMRRGAILTARRFLLDGVLGNAVATP